MFGLRARERFMSMKKLLDESESGGELKIEWKSGVYGAKTED